MPSPTPPIHKIAAPLWETATMDDLWRVSDLAGVSACALLSATHEVFRGDAQLAR